MTFACVHVEATLSGPSLRTYAQNSAAVALPPGAAATV